MLEVDGIESRHCKLSFSDGKVSLMVEEGVCSVNSEEVKEMQELSHGE